MTARGVLRIGEGDHLLFWCPGCKEMHQIRARADGQHHPGEAWGFNLDYDKPTFTPSVLVRGKRRITDDEYDRIRAGERLSIPDQVCHSFVTDGQIQFLGDCTHELAGQTVALEMIGKEAQ